MKFKNEVFILSVQAKENRNKEPYVILNIADVDGNTFQIVSKNLELLGLQQFTKYTVNLELTNSKYGYHISIVDIE